MSRFPLNLQLFAGGENEPEPADPVTGTELIDEPEPAETPDDDPGEGGEGGENEPAHAAPAIDQNAIYAQARRAADRRMNELDSRVASRFGNMRNPETGQPIRTTQDYFDALDAQERMNARREVQRRGVDPGLIDRMIANNPVIRQAQQVIRDNTLRQGEMELENQIQQISSFDPSVKSLDDIVKMPTFPVFDAYVRQGLSITDAYRLANFDSLAQRDAAANRQAAINSVRGKSHLAPIGGVAGEAGKQLVDIPQNERYLWEEAYPDLSYKELKEKYNKTL